MLWAVTSNQHWLWWMAQSSWKSLHCLRHIYIYTFNVCRHCSVQWEGDSLICSLPFCIQFLIVLLILLDFNSQRPKYVQWWGILLEFVGFWSATILDPQEVLIRSPWIMTTIGISITKWCDHKVWCPMIPLLSDGDPGSPSFIYVLNLYASYLPMLPI